MREFLNLALSDAIKSLDKTTPKLKRMLLILKLIILNRLILVNS